MRATIISVITGAILAYVASKFLGTRRGKKYLKKGKSMGYSFIKMLKRNTFISQALVKTLIKQMLRRFQLAR